MTTVALKEKLHQYVNSANDEKLQALYAYVTSGSGAGYDEATFNLFQEISDDYFAGKIKGSSVEESMDRIHRQISMVS